MRRWHVPWHVIETEWTFAQYLWLLEGVEANEELGAEDGSYGASGGGGEMRAMTADEQAAMAGLLPASMLAEAVYRE